MNGKLSYMAMVFAALSMGCGPNKVFAEPRRKNVIGHNEPNLDFEHQLEAKGLKRFVINGQEIIAHNEREANKRYRHTYHQMQNGQHQS